VLPIEIILQTCRVANQEILSVVEYVEIMMDSIDDIWESQFRALREIEKEKLRVTKTYNKKVWEKWFEVGELVWKIFLPLGIQDNKFGNWLPSWEGPFRVVGIVPENSYFCGDIGRAKISQGIE
jgi:hypothetical protein